MNPITIFEKYVYNINLLLENELIDKKYNSFRDKYICPICLNSYESIEANKDNPLTLEDAPQKALGGKKRTLTCKKCNNEAGSNVDHHLINRLKELDNQRFSPNTSARIQTYNNGVKLNASIDIDNKGRIKLKHSNKDNNPKILNEEISKLNKGSVLDMSFRRTTQIIPDKLDIAVLKSAYIILFQHTGYHIILDESYDFIRHQILNPEERLLPKNFYFYSNFQVYKEGVYFICENDCEIILVSFITRTKNGFKNFCVFLPLPNKEYLSVIEKILFKKKMNKEISLKAFPNDISAVDYISDIKNISRLNNWLNSFK